MFFWVLYDSMEMGPIRFSKDILKVTFNSTLLNLSAVFPMHAVFPVHACY